MGAYFGPAIDDAALIARLVEAAPPLTDDADRLLTDVLAPVVQAVAGRHLDALVEEQRAA